MPATVIGERIGWTRGKTILANRVRDLRPAYLPPDPAGRTTYRPGELAQWDLWYPAIDIPVGVGQVGRLSVLAWPATRAGSFIRLFNAAVGSGTGSGARGVRSLST